MITALQLHPALLHQPVAAFRVARALLLLAFNTTAPDRACLQLLDRFWCARAPSLHVQKPKPRASVEN